MNWSDLTQYDQAAARRLVDGYLIARQATETNQQWFHRARCECVAALRKRALQIESMEFHQMFPKAAPSTSPSPKEPA